MSVRYTQPVDDADKPLFNWGAAAVLAFFPGVRTFVGWFGLIGLTVGGICFIIPPIVQSHVPPGSPLHIMFLFGMFCGLISFGLLFAIWLPATVLAAIGRKITGDNGDEEVEERDEEEEEYHPPPRTRKKSHNVRIEPRF